MHPYPHSISISTVILGVDSSRLPVSLQDNTNQ
jgi:hypothetical protein